MSRFSLRTQLILLSLTLVIGFVFFGGETWRTLSKTKVGGPAYERLVMQKDLVADILPPPSYIIESYLTAVLLADPERAVERPGLIKQLRQLRQEYDDRHSFWAKQELSAAIRSAFLEKAHAPAQQFYALVENKLIPQVDAGNMAEVRAALKEADALYQQHRQGIEEVVKLATAEQTEIENRTATDIRSSSLVLMAVFALSCLAALAVNVLFGRSLRSGIEEARVALVELGRGNLAFSQQSERADELGDLLRSLSATTQQLRQTVGKVHTVAEAVGGSATELLTNIEDIAQASYAQSDAVTSVAATVEQMSSGISQMAAVSASSKGRASEAEQACRHGSGEIEATVAVVEKLASDVQTTAESVNSLGESSREISTIISAIREIADQTNLLALNAAIEAARAGEQGRGFAVVADEVRKLAERTATSTDQIARMISQIQSGISQAVASMSEGSQRARTSIEVVQRARQTVSGIAQETSALLNDILEIATALEVQRTGSSNIASEIEKIAHASQSNSATTNHVTATARNMSETAQQLRNAMGAFRC